LRYYFLLTRRRLARSKTKTVLREGPARLKSPTPATSRRKHSEVVGIAAKPPLDFGEPAESAVDGILAFALIGEVQAPTAQVKPVTALIEPYGTLIAPTAEIGLRPAELARTALDTDVLGHTLPVPIVFAHLDLDPDFVLWGLRPQRLSSLMSRTPGQGSTLARSWGRLISTEIRSLPSFSGNRLTSLDRRAGAVRFLARGRSFPVLF
jgi:hypothetical protein